MKLYDISSLPPVPSLLPPLVMPTGNLCEMPQELPPLVMPTGNLCEMPQELPPLVMPTGNLCEMPQELPPLVMPTKSQTNVAMRTTLTNKMSWADMCESDVEDDDF
jgi:hypothetical protein